MGAEIIKLNFFTFKNVSENFYDGATLPAYSVPVLMTSPDLVFPRISWRKMLLIFAEIVVPLLSISVTLLT